MPTVSGTATTATLGITRDLGEGNPDYLAVPVGQIIDAAVTANDIMATNGSMVSPEEFAYALNKYFAGGYTGVDPQPVGSARAVVLLVTSKLHTISNVRP